MQFLGSGSPTTCSISPTTAPVRTEWKAVSIQFRRAEQGQHHLIASNYLSASAREMRSRKDTRREPTAKPHTRRAGAA